MLYLSLLFGFIGFPSFLPSFLPPSITPKYVGPLTTTLLFLILVVAAAPFLSVRRRLLWSWSYKSCCIRPDTDPYTHHTPLSKPTSPCPYCSSCIHPDMAQQPGIMRSTAVIQPLLCRNCSSSQQDVICVPARILCRRWRKYILV